LKNFYKIQVLYKLNLKGGFCMKQVGKIKYELSEQEYKEIKNLVRDVLDYFNNENDYRDAKFSIQRLFKIIERVN
jgi:hypothetical protein